MEAMPEDIRSHFMNREHTMHHTDGLFNGIWSDMAIETTFMRYGHSRGGIIGITLQPDTVKTWAYSLHACNSLTSDLQAMRDTEQVTEQSQHKEEMRSRICADQRDHKTLQEKLELCINPLDPEQHPQALVNVVTGKVVTNPSVNVSNALQLGRAQMENFEDSWPNGFHDTIPKVVNTMGLSRKHIKVGDIKVFDTETIYARAMGLVRSSRVLDTNQLLSHELAPHPPSMFDSTGHMREAKTKASLKNALKVELSERLAENIMVRFLDGCAVLWVVPWPANGTVQDYLKRFRAYLINQLRQSDVYLIFDRQVHSQKSIYLSLSYFTLLKDCNFYIFCQIIYNDGST